MNDKEVNHTRFETGSALDFGGSVKDSPKLKEKKILYPKKKKKKKKKKTFERSNTIVV
jgi:hypothetical protein